jgi:methionyl-tRNA formyltransferase
VSFDVVGRACMEAAAEAGAEVVGVVTLPGPLDPERAGQCSFSEISEKLGARLVESDDVNSPETLAAVRELEPDLVFVIGWSQLLLEDFISCAREGVFGVHPTLLPRHRGRAPIPWAILSGLARTGVTLFEIADPTADSGPIVGQTDVQIERDETATTLYDKVATAHVELIRRFVPQLLEGRATRTPQDSTRASVWPKRSPADGIIDWETRAPYLYDWVRAQTRPYPGAFTYVGTTRVVVWRATPLDLDVSEQAGTVLERRAEGVLVACGEGGLLLEELEPDGIVDQLRVGEVLG